MANVKILMTSAGVLALTTGFAAAAPAVVENSVNLRSGPGTQFPVITAMPAGATVDVAGCGEAWCRVNFEGTPGFASRGFLGIGGVAMGPAYERGYAYGGYEPGYRYGSRYGYEPGYGARYSESPGYGASVAYGGEREFRGARGLRGERELRGEGREGGERTTVRGEDRGQSRAAEIQGANPMINPKTVAPAGRARGSEPAGQIGGNNPMINAKSAAGATANEGSRSTSNSRVGRASQRTTTGAGASQ